MFGIELMRLLNRRGRMTELKSHKFKDGTTIVLFEDDTGNFAVAQFDRTDIEMWESEFDTLGDATTEYNKRVQQGIEKEKDRG
jgi:hypothetical protein